jgi:hypothetical protein
MQPTTTSQTGGPAHLVNRVTNVACLPVACQPVGDQARAPQSRDVKQPTFKLTGVLILLGMSATACGASASNASGSPPSATPTISTSPPTTSSPSPDPTEGWLSFSSTVGRLSFRYDPTWKLTECAPGDSPLIVLGQNACREIEPSFSVDSTVASQIPAAPDLRCDPGQPSATSSSVTVDGVMGTKESIDYTATAYNDCRHPIEDAVVYSFYTGGRAYTVTYLYLPSEGADQTGEVDQLVQTLKFSA